MMNYIDTHTHFNDEAFVNNIEEEIKLGKSLGVDRFFVIGWDVESSKKAIEIANTYEECYAVVGFHPSNVKGYTDKEYDTLKEIAKSPKVVAIGEIGFDYHWDTTTKEEQEIAFIKQLEIAKELNLPVSIHSRDADQDTFDILKKYFNNNLGGVIHAYSGSLELAKEYVKMNFLIGVGGVLTFKNARRLVETVVGLSLDYLITETDSPYLAPVPHRGETNHSAYIPLVVDKIGELKNVSKEDIIISVNNNVKRIFNI